ncbi:MAG: porin [Methylobacteriaceae bacterium]|nr:porin [Methylobacteriaceae bacterium]
MSTDELADLVRAQAAEIRSLRQEVDSLKRGQSRVVTEQKRVSEDVKQVRSARTVVAGKDGEPRSLFDPEDFIHKGRKPGSWRIPGSEFDLSIHGYAKLDYITRLTGQTSGAEDLFITNNILTSPAPGVRPPRGTDARNRIHARESRFNIEVAGPTEFGPARAFIEGDFFGAVGNQIESNSDSFRLRHALIEVGPFLAGQWWSAFEDPSASLNTLDFQSTNGYSFIRQGQIRYTHKFDGELTGFSLAGSIENSESRLLNAATNTVLSAQDTNVPDFVVQARYEAGWGHLQAATVLRNTSGRTPIPAVAASATPFGARFGYGANVSGVINTPLLGDKDNVRFQVNYGEGIGRYIQDVGIGSADYAFSPALGRAVAIEALGLYGGYQHYWLPNLRSTVGYSYVSVNNPSFVTGTALRETHYGVANLIWSPFAQFDVGIEGLYGRRTNQNGLSGESSRIQSSAILRF